MRFFLRTLILGTLFWGMTGSASAMTITPTSPEEMAKYGISATAATKPKPAPKPQPQPKKIVEPAVAALPSSSSAPTSSTTSSGGSSSSVPVADLPTTIDLLPASSGESLATSDWLYIPPRFLDGVFRPPRV